MQSQRRDQRTIVLRKSENKTYSAASSLPTQASTPVVTSAVPIFADKTITIQASEASRNRPNVYSHGPVNSIELENQLLKCEIKELKSVNRQLLQTCQQLKLLSRN